MPTYSIQGPDGKTYSIDGPAGATRDQVIAKIKEKQGTPAAAPAAPSEQPSVAGDVVNSFGRGVVKGAIGLAGLPGDIATGINKGEDYVTRKLGFEPPPSTPVGTSQQIEKGVEKVAGPLGQPQTTAGKYAQSVGEFIPGMAIGPEGAIAKAGMAVAGGVGAEAGGAVAGPWGRFFGGLVGGAGAGTLAAEAQSARLAGRLPSAQDIKNSAQAAYKQVENARLIASEGSLNGLVSSLRAGLDQRLMDANVAPQSSGALQQLEASGGDVAGIMSVRQRLGEVNPSAGTDYEAAQHIRDSIDHYIETLPPTEVVQGDPQFTQAMLDHARQSWRAYAKLDQVHTALEIGEHQAAVAGTGANTQNAMRQRVRSILDSERNVRGFSPEARQQMENIVMGTWLSNAARYVGKFAPSGPVSAMATGAALMGSGPVAAAAVAIPATIAKYLGTYLTRRQIQELENTIRAESPIGQGIARQNAAQAPSYGAIAPMSALRAGAGSALADPQSQ